MPLFSHKQKNVFNSEQVCTIDTLYTFANATFD